MTELRQVAEWMFKVLQREGMLPQRHAAEVIRERFGPQYVYQGDSDHVSIHDDVLCEFQRLSAGAAVWDVSRRYWRLKEIAVDPTETLFDDRVV